MNDSSEQLVAAHQQMTVGGGCTHSRPKSRQVLGASAESALLHKTHPNDGTLLDATIYRLE
jgi:hypothetical protein